MSGASMQWVKAIVLTISVVGTLAAQGDQPEGLYAQKRGETWVVKGKVDGVILKTVLVDLAEDTGRELKMEPGILKKITEVQVTASLNGMLLDEALDHLTGVAMLAGRVEDAAIQITHRANRGTKEAAPEARANAGKTWRRLGLHQLRDESPVALYRVGVLYYAGEEWKLALSAFRTFYETNGDDPRVPRARLLAGYAALQDKRYGESRTILSAIEDFHPDAPEILESTLLLARVYMAEGEAEEAILRLRRVATQLGNPRLRADAILLRTRMWYERGEYAQALESIEEFDRSLQRMVPELEDQVALAVGLCLVAAGKPLDSFVHLQHAWLTLEDPNRRLEAAIALGDAWLDSGDHLSALQIAKLAGSLEVTGTNALRARSLQARVWKAVGIARRQKESLLGLLRQETRQDPVGKKIMVAALSDLADLLFEQEDFKSAKSLFQELEAVPDLGLRAKVMRARCERAMANHHEVIRLLEEIPADAPGVDRHEVVRLMGEAWMALGEHDRATLVFLGGSGGDK